MIKILNTTDSLKVVKDNFDNHDRVFFTRFGDCDIIMLSGTDLKGDVLTQAKAWGGNRTIWSKDIQRELKESFTIDHPQYMQGLSCSWETEEGMKNGLFANFKYKERLEQKALQYNKKDVYLSPVLFHYLMCFKNKVFNDFVDQYISGKKILYIGSTPVNHAEKIVGPIAHSVVTPPTNAYYNINEWWTEVEKILKNEDIDVVIPSAGQSSRVISKRIFKMGTKVHSLDLGSIFDIFKKPTRTWLKMKGEELQKIYQ